MSSISAGTTSTTTLVHSGDTTGSLVFKTNDTGSGGTTAMTIDTSQNVTCVGNITLNNGAADGAQLTLASSGYSNWNIDNYSGNLRAYYNATEYMRMDTSGNLLVGITSSPAISGVPSNSAIVNSGTGGNWALGVQNTAASGGARGIAVNYSAQTPNNTQSEPYFFNDSSAYRFRLVSNGGIYNYSANNSNISDRREKTNFAPSKPYLNVICSIPVQTFNYIDQNRQEDDGLTLGVVAQDVQAVAPEFVTEANWGTEENPKMRLSIYQTDLQYALMKSIQELKAINDQQAETINALTARVVALENK